MRHPTPALLVLLAVGCEDPLDWCHDPAANHWCFHDEAEGGPVLPEMGAICAPPVPAGEPEACGRYEVHGSSGGYTGGEHYFLDGAHVGTRYWTDTSTYCGGFDFEYGRTVDCD